MRHLIITLLTVLLTAMTLSAAPQTAAEVKADAAKAVNTAQSQIKAAGQAANAVNFDSIEAEINAALPELNTTAPSAATDRMADSDIDFTDDDDDSTFDFGGNFMQMLAVIGLFVLPPVAVVLIVFFALYFRSRNKRAQYEAMARAAQNGVVMPPIPMEPTCMPTRSSYSAAVTLIAIGLGLLIFFSCAGEWRIGIGIGCIPALIGAARLLTRWLDNRKA